MIIQWTKLSEQRYTSETGTIRSGSVKASIRKSAGWSIFVGNQVGFADTLTEAKQVAKEMVIERIEILKAESKKIALEQEQELLRRLREERDTRPQFSVTYSGVTGLHTFKTTLRADSRSDAIARVLDWQAKQGFEVTVETATETK